MHQTQRPFITFLLLLFFLAPAPVKPAPLSPPPPASPPATSPPPKTVAVAAVDNEGVITLEFRRQKAKELQEYFKQKKLIEVGNV